MDIKGILVSIGGAEDKGSDIEEGLPKPTSLNFFELGILKNVAHLIGDPTSRIEVITTASMIPEEVGDNYLKAFSKLGYDNVGHLSIRNREEVMHPDTIERINKCCGIMFSGGNQLRLSSIFGGTEALDIITNRYINEHFVISGTSAGAMAMSRNMIYEGKAELAHLKGEVKITSGLGFITGVIIDSHFDKRGRFMRLAQAVATNPGTIGIGLGEDTGVIIKNGTQLEIIGSGGVVILDGRSIGFNNIADIEFNTPISVEDIRVHILEKGNGFDVKSRKFIADVSEVVTLAKAVD